jgi:hypothetical protein
LSMAGAVPNSACHWAQLCLCRLLIIAPHNVKLVMGNVHQSYCTKRQSK